MGSWNVTRKISRQDAKNAKKSQERNGLRFRILSLAFLASWREFLRLRLAGGKLLPLLA